MALTRADLINAFRELGELAVEAGKVIDLAVYGGSALMLVSNFRSSSWDMDAVALADQGFVDRAAQVIAARHRWSADWLNDGVRTYLSPSIEDHAEHELFATYPDESRPGLRVYVPTAEYMLAMKLMALRIEPTGGKDLGDIVNLMRAIGIGQKTELLDIASKFYPEARISGKLRLALDQLWRAYQAPDAHAADGPPKYLGRSGAPPEG